ncbi:hypothetical protein HanXRQr2_Chr15g0695521 [Helianthus annuus]|uniref:Uncharacterized protein n=1 Tax=Helianthus annuus TaxID=4232 RepID=A0A9K3E0J5_HELAN|nr:hypothetical protein HanXRQr2_Chr15g0695521 [Helianthus annuus]KAJ0831476.1 hypothetical protein HanPSC8_Chr15g0667481 [Helianthus annuus]
MNISERSQPLFIFVFLTYQMKFRVRVCSFIKRMNINEFSAEWFTNCWLNVRFVYSPKKLVFSWDHFWIN